MLCELDSLSPCPPSPLSLLTRPPPCLLPLIIGDDWESLYCDKPAMVRAPAPIGAVRRASLAEFRRKSLDLERMANEAKVQATGTLTWTR